MHKKFKYRWYFRLFLAMTESSDNSSILLFAVAKFPVSFIGALVSQVKQVLFQQKGDVRNENHYDNALRVNKLGVFKIDLTSVTNFLLIKHPP